MFETSDLLIDGFHPNPIRLDRTAHGGGIVVYWASHLMVKRKSNFEFDSGENIWLEVIYPNYSFMLCTLYRPPNCNIQFWDHLEYSIENVINYNPNIVIVGDINVDMLTNRAHRINDLLNQYQFTNVIHGPTRIGDTRSSLLDPILVRECSVGFSRLSSILTVIFQIITQLKSKLLSILETRQPLKEKYGHIVRLIFCLLITKCLEKKLGWNFRQWCWNRMW